MGLLHFHSEIPRIQASVKAEADESAEAAAAAQYVELKFRWRICMYAHQSKILLKYVSPSVTHGKILVQEYCVL